MATIRFTNCAVLDGIHPERREGCDVLVEDERIVEVSPKPIKAKGATVYDVRGRTLMPGLIDAHIHAIASSANLFRLHEQPESLTALEAKDILEAMLMRGFTSVRDAGGADSGLKQAVERGLIKGPRLFIAGKALSQTGGHADGRPVTFNLDTCACCQGGATLGRIADGISEVRRAARDELRKGASHIKIMGSGGVMSPNDPLERAQYSESEIRAIVEECTRHGTYVCAHCHPSVAIRRCVEFGVRCIEHGTLIDEQTAAFVAQQGAYVVPTMAVIFALLEDGEAKGVPPVSMQKLLKIQEGALSGLQIMKRAGVKMGFGTDLLGEQHTRQGTEFTLRRQVLTPFDILHSATAVNAEILQMQGRLGVVKAGAYADLLVVNGNPLQDIGLLAANGKHLTHIMVNGQFVKR